MKGKRCDPVLYVIGTTERGNEVLSAWKRKVIKRRDKIRRGTDPDKYEFVKRTDVQTI